MVHLDWLRFASAREDEHSPKLSDVCLLNVLHPEEVYTQNKQYGKKLTDQEVLETLVLVRILEWLTLEDQEWLDIVGNQFGGIKGCHWLIAFDAALEHVKDVSVVNTPYRQIIRSLLLVTTHREQRTIVLD